MMKVTERLAWPRTAPLALAATTLLAACDDSSPDAPREGPSNATLSPPSFVLESRMVDPAGLSVQLTVDGIPTDPVERGDVWVTRFTLAEARTYEFSIVWTYTPPRSDQEIVVARFGPSDVDNAMQTRDIRVLESDYVRPDDDGDGVDNLDEIERGTDPSETDAENFGPRARQGDCRETRLAGTRIGDEQDAPRDRIGLSSDPVSVTRAPELEAGRHLYFATFLLEVPGTLTIVHLSGLPADTNASLYDRREDAPADEGTADVRVDANATDTADGVPARISAELVEPGLYCYVLFDEVAELGAGTPLSDVVLGIEFTPAEGG